MDQLVARAVTEDGVQVELCSRLDAGVEEEEALGHDGSPGVQGDCGQRDARFTTILPVLAITAAARAGHGIALPEAFTTASLLVLVVSSVGLREPELHAVTAANRNDPPLGSHLFVARARIPNNLLRATAVLLHR